MNKPSLSPLFQHHSDFYEVARLLGDYLQDNAIKSTLLGVSGGADSTLLFLLMLEATRQIPEFRLGAAHANFNLRGEESLRDRRFVESLVDFYRPSHPHITLFMRDFDTLAYCKEKGLSVEMGARDLRHDWWRDLVAAHNFDRIVTGHNADDNVETLMLNLLRGSGTKGLKGMPYDDGRILRPLLRMPRTRILQYLEELGESFVEDSTNAESDYRRNFLRNRVLPLIKEEWPAASKSMTRSLRLLEEENRIVEASLKAVIGRYPSTLPIFTILSYPSPLTLLYRWIEPFGGTTEIAEEILQVLQGGNIHGQRWRVAGQAPDSSQYSIIASPGVLRREESSAATVATEGEKPFDKYEVRHYPALTEDDRIRIAATPADAVWLPDPPESYRWRTPHKGERMMLFSKPGCGRKTKLISDILKEAKIPLAERKNIAILVDATTDQPVWIPGIRRAGSSLITPESTEAWLIYPIFSK